MMSVAERRLEDSLLSQMRMYLWSCYWLQQSEPFCLMLRDSAASLRVADAWRMNHSPTKRGSKSSAFARCYSDFGHYYHLLHCYVMQNYKCHTGASLATCGSTIPKTVVHHNLHPWKFDLCVYIQPHNIA